MSKLPHFLFLLTLAILGLLLFCLLQPEHPAAHGLPHPRFSEMNQGGESSRHENILVAASLYGGLQIVLLVFALGLGIRLDRSTLIPIFTGCVAYVAVFAAMVVTYLRGMNDAPIVFGFALPTALMVFGISGTPTIFVVLYIVKFKQWIYNEDDAERFAQLLAQSRKIEVSRSQKHG